jgi:hypothetical protein
MQRTEHEWGVAILVKETSEGFIRIMKIKAGGRIKLSVKPETLYLQGGVVLCMPDNQILSEGCGDISYHIEAAEVEILAISDATVYETRYMN